MSILVRYTKAGSMPAEPCAPNKSKIEIVSSTSTLACGHIMGSNGTIITAIINEDIREFTLGFNSLHDYTMNGSRDRFIKTEGCKVTFELNGYNVVHIHENESDWYEFSKAK